jgi:hypothetical protein
MFEVLPSGVVIFMFFDQSLVFINSILFKFSQVTLVLVPEMFVGLFFQVIFL